jgi:putative effector of murein hydrolase
VEDPRTTRAMRKSLTAITLFDMAGDSIQSTARLPIPGPVIGMALLLLALITIGSIVAVLLLTGTAYRTYFETAAWIHFILGPATVALAIPLYKNIGEIRRSTLAIGAAVAAGAITASGSAMAMALRISSTSAAVAGPV